jgi:hypothetical protein
VNLSSNTQYIIRKYIKNNKYSIILKTFKISFTDTIDIIILLQEEYTKTTDENIKKAIDELRKERFKK